MSTPLALYKHFVNVSIYRNKTNFSGEIKFGKGLVTLKDVTAGNGAVHAISEVLFPDFKSFSTKKKSMNLMQVLESNGYTSFAKALRDTGLDKVISVL